MFFELSALHLCLMSILGSWLSWNKHFRWAVNFNYIKALWILFKCQDPKVLAFNISVYALYFNSSHTGKSEALIILCYLFNLLSLNFAPILKLANFEWMICWCVFAALCFPSTFAFNLSGKVMISEKIISAAIIISMLMKTTFVKAIACLMLPALAVLGSRIIQGSSGKFRSIKKVEKFIDPAVLSMK